MLAQLVLFRCVVGFRIDLVGSEGLDDTKVDNDRLGQLSGLERHESRHIKPQVDRFVFPSVQRAVVLQRRVGRCSAENGLVQVKFLHVLLRLRCPLRLQPSQCDRASFRLTAQFGLRHLPSFLVSNIPSWCRVPPRTRYWQRFVEALEGIHGLQKNDVYLFPVQLDVQAGILHLPALGVVLTVFPRDMRLLLSRLKVSRVNTAVTELVQC